MLYPGLYEQVINNALNRELAEIPEARKSTAPIDTAEAAKVLAQYLTDVVQKGLENVQDNGGGIEAQIQLANQIVATIQNTTQEADFAALGVDQRAEQLLALLQQNDPRLATGKSAKDLDRPETSILFVSIQTFNSQELAAKTAADFYDYIVVDEFHHAAAPTYQKLLEYYQPKILLGLTATPECMDGKSILDYFGGRIAVEIRLPEAIGRKLLCPFQYFGVTDTADLSSLKWRTGGYDKADARFGGAGAYTYLGTVNYVKHEGSRPMNITWKLERPIPAKFLKKTNKLVVG